LILLFGFFSASPILCIAVRVPDEETCCMTSCDGESTCENESQKDSDQQQPADCEKSCLIQCCQCWFIPAEQTNIFFTKPAVKMWYAEFNDLQVKNAVNEYWRPPEMQTT